MSRQQIRSTFRSISSTPTRRSAARLTRRLGPVFILLALSLAVILGVEPRLVALGSRAQQDGATAQDPAGDQAIAQQTCTVNCNATVPATGTAGQNVSFQAAATTSGCATAPSYQWNFGDGGTSAQQNPTYVYNNPGTYNWSLTVTASGAGGGVSTINTIAGGEGENTPSTQASYNRLNAIARDPLGRGFFLAANNLSSLQSGEYIYFTNTTNAPVTLAGKTFAPGVTRIIAGGGLIAEGENVSGLDSFIFPINGLAVSPDGNVVYYIDATNPQPRVRALNIGTSNITIGGGTLNPNNIRTLASGFGSLLFGIAVDPSDGAVFVADSTPGINRVSRIVPTTGASAFIVGNGQGPLNANDPYEGNGTAASSIKLFQPHAIKFDASGALIVSDTRHSRVLRFLPPVTANSGAMLVGVIPNDGIEPYPSGLGVVGNTVYVANGEIQTIRQVGAGGSTQIAGQYLTGCTYSISPNSCGDGGPVAGATFAMHGRSSSPPLAGMDADSNGLYLIDQSLNNRARIRYLNLSGGPVTLAGVTVAAGTIQTIGGAGLQSSSSLTESGNFDGGIANGAHLPGPNGLTFDGNENLWISDATSNRLRFVNLGASAVTIFAGTLAQQNVPPGAIVSVNYGAPEGGDLVPAHQTLFNNPQGLFATSQGIWITDSLGGARIPPGFGGTDTSLLKFMNTSASNVTLFPGSASPIIVPPGHVARVAGCDTAENCPNNGQARTQQLVGVSDVVVLSNGDIILAESGQLGSIRRINGNTGAVSSLTAPFGRYTGLGLGPDGRIYATDAQNGNLVRESGVGTGVLTGFATGLGSPRDVAVGADGTAYVTSAQTHRILQVTSAGSVSVFAGSSIGFSGDGGAATSARLNQFIPDLAIANGTFIPRSIGIAMRGTSTVGFVDPGNRRIRQVGAGASIGQCVRSGTIQINPTNNPVPAITSLSPNQTVAGGGGFQLTVNGTGFVPGSVVLFNGMTRTTTYVSAMQLQAQILSGDIANGGAATVTVFNPAPGGGSSPGSTFTITNPQPAITSLSPASATAGAGAFNLTVFGTNFVSSSTVHWNGSPRTTTFNSATQLTASITANDILNMGTAAVTVVNPTPGGGASNAVNFTITAAGQGLEADVAPRPGGNGAVTLADWVQIGRFAAGLDAVNAGTEFQRADCAPAATNGNGAVTLADWVQAGRYAAALDSPVPSAGGPTAPSFTLEQSVAAIGNLVSAPDQTRVVRVVNATIQRGQSGTVTIEFVANGNEGAIAFNLSFDPAQLAYVKPPSGNSSLLLGPGMPSGSAITVNDSDQQLMQGRVGFLLLAPFGATIPAGTRQVLNLTFMALASGTGNSTTIGFADGPTKPEVTDPNGNELLPLPTFQAGTITLTGGNNPVPTLTSLNPNSVNAGSGAFTLTVNGSNFVMGSVVRWNGVDRPTTFVNSTQLTAAIPASDVANPGSAEVRVFTPMPGGGLSDPLTFGINAAPNPVPAITSISPNTVTAGGGNFNLTVNGSNFVAGSVVRVNGSDRSTIFNSAGQLTATILASDIAAVGTRDITVFSPTPGGGTSNSVTLTINQQPTSTVRVVNATIQRGQNGVVGVELVASGLENAVGFSLTFDTTQLGFVSAVPGSGTAGAQVNINTALIGSGILAVNLAQPAGVTFAAGTHQLVAITFNALSSGSASTTPVNFSDVPIIREVVNANGNDLPSVFQNGAVTITQMPNPVPAITSINPALVTAGGAAFMLQVNGNNFVGSSVVTFNGSPRTTTFVNATQLTAAITADDILQAGAANIAVINPSPGGGTSNAVQLTINDPSNPAPTITNVNPSSVTAGSGNLNLTITGTNYVAGSTVQFNGIPLATTFNSATQLTVQVPAANLVNAGTANIVVINPPPGGGSSNIFLFTINNPAPNVTSINPTTITAGGAAFTLTVNGNGFAPGSIVQFNGINRVTTFVSATQLTAAISEADIASAGMALVTVLNPAPGGGTSNAVNFTVAPAGQLPVITQLNPNSALVGGVQFALRVMGANFIPTSRVRFNGVDRTTTFDSTNQLTAIIPAAAISQAGTVPVTVFNPGVNGGESSPASFNIQGPNPVPAITSLNPNSIPVGSNNFVLTVNGSNFVDGAVVLFNGAARATTFVNATQVTAQIPATDVVEPGTVTVRVLNPTPGGGLSNEVNFLITPGNPVPALTSLNPASVAAGGAAFTLQVNGTGFVQGSVIRVNNVNRTTTFVSPTQLTTQISAADIANAGNLSITVSSPGPGGGVSNALQLAVLQPNQVPVVNSLTPSGAATGGPAFTLTVNGANFVPGAVVRFNGANRDTIFISATQLQAAIPASDIAAPGNFPVTVVNPAPGGGLSNAVNFSVGNPNPAPTLTSLNPASVMARSGDFQLTVTGTNFITASVVEWNGAPRPTTFVSGTMLRAQIPASDITFPGTASVTVFNPAPGGGRSTALSFMITNPAPGITALNPSTALVGGQGFTLIVIGTNFVEDSTVRWNGQSRPTAFINSTQLQAQIPAMDIDEVGTASVTVFTPSPGGGVSNELIFTITTPNPVPVLSSISPNFAFVGGQQFVLTAIGTGFAPSSFVRWNGQSRQTTFVSPTMLTAIIPSSDISFLGSASVTVFTPGPGGGQSLAQRFTIARELVAVNAASLLEGPVGQDSILAAFGTDLATGIAVANMVPLPTELLGTTVSVRDSAGTSRPAGIFSVAPGQVNLALPAGTATGLATITITSGDGSVSIGQVQVNSVGPGIFAANANGQGVAAALILRVRADGSTSYEPVAEFDEANNQFVPVPINLGPETDQVFLILFGTGVRGRTSLENVDLEIDGMNIGVLFAGEQSGFIGLDQINSVQLPRTLAGRGLVDVTLSVDGQTSNTVRISFE